MNPSLLRSSELTRSVTFSRSLVFDDVKCKIVQGENNKELTTLDWDSVAALKFIARPFASASIFLEISRTSKNGMLNFFGPAISS